jgi:hypothetical protein
MPKMKYVCWSNGFLNVSSICFASSWINDDIPKFDEYHEFKWGPCYQTICLMGENPLRCMYHSRWKGYNI